MFGQNGYIQKASHEVKENKNKKLRCHFRGHRILQVFGWLRNKHFITMLQFISLYSTEERLLNCSNNVVIMTTQNAKYKFWTQPISIACFNISMVAEKWRF